MQPRGHGGRNNAAFSDHRNTMCSATASGDQRNIAFLAFSDKRNRTPMMQTEAIFRDRKQNISRRKNDSVFDTKV